MPRAGCFTQRVLRVALPAGEPAHRGGSLPHGRDSGCSRRERRRLRRAPHPCHLADSRSPDRTSPRRQTDAGRRPAWHGRAAPPGANDRQPAQLPDRAEPARAELYRRGAEPGLAGGSDLHSYRRRLALSRGAHRHAYPQGRRLGDARDAACRDRRRGSAHGHRASAAGPGAHPTHGSRRAIRGRCVSPSPCRRWDNAFDEPARQLPRQRAHGELLPHPQGRASPPPCLRHPRRGAARLVRIHRGLLQCLVTTHISLCC